jgi:hypothetical protein
MIVLFFLHPSYSQNKNAEYETYFNERFGYQIDYPKKLLIPQGEAFNGDGQVFLSQDKKIELKVWGRHNALFTTLKEEYSNYLDDHVAYKVIKPSENWFVVSKKTKNKILYIKAILKNDIYYFLQFEYDEDNLKLMNDVISKVLKSFRVPD